jgi:hypothetical protein
VCLLRNATEEERERQSDGDTNKQVLRNVGVEGVEEQRWKDPIKNSIFALIINHNCQKW